MKNSKSNDQANHQAANDLDQQWFDRQMSGQLRKFDAVHEPVVPKIPELETMVKTHKREMIKKQLRDLLLFWLIALPVLSTMFWVLERDWIWFAVIQSLVAAGAVFYASMMFRKRVSRQWNKH